MRYYVEAYDASGNMILGNLDGQACLNCKYPERTAHYRRLVNTPKEKLSLYGRVVTYKITDPNGKIYDIIRK